MYALKMSEPTIQETHCYLELKNHPYFRSTAIFAAHKPINMKPAETPSLSDSIVRSTTIIMICNMHTMADHTGVDWYAKFALVHYEN